MSGFLRKGFGMFGNGQEPPAAPPDTGSLWGDVFGVGSLFKLISDPALMAHTHQMIGAVIEGANANRRIEAKLDRLLKALGHDLADINARFPADFQPGFIAPLLEGDRTPGSGGVAAAIGASDDGSRRASASAATHGGAVRGGGEFDPAPGSSR